MRQWAIPSAFGVIFLLSLVFSEYYLPIVLLLNGLLIFSILQKLGKEILLRELICLHGCIFCLLMPWLGYEWYTKSNALSSLWVSYMPVRDHIYFPFALPAMAGFTFAMCLPINKNGVSDQGSFIHKYLAHAGKLLESYPRTGLVLIITGIFFLYVRDYLPESLRYPADLAYTSSYAGALYIFFNKKMPYRLLILALFATFIFIKALGGMFTEIAYMSVTLFSFFFIGKRTPMFKKVLVFVTGLFFIVILQSVKLSYRKIVWGKGTSENKAVLFGKIAADKITNVSNLWDVNAFFPIYVRFNQGFNVGLVMRRYPRVKPFDDGQQLFYNISSSFVPRFLWPDKPMAGGKFNMSYYAGVKLTNWSTNVGPLGEAYASFGVTGGIIFMFLLGLFVRWAYRKLLLVSANIPLLLFWLPVLFYQVTYSLEADTLQILNSLVKSALFLFIIYKIYPPLMGVVRKEEQGHKKFSMQ